MRSLQVHVTWAGQSTPPPAPPESHSRADDPQLLILRPTFYCPQSFCGLFSGWMWTNYHLLWLSGFDCNQILLYLYPGLNQALSFWSFKMGRLLGENLGQRQAVARRQATMWTLSFGTQKSSSNKAPQWFWRPPNKCIQDLISKPNWSLNKNHADTCAGDTPP